MNTFTDLLNEIKDCQFDFNCKFNSLDHENPDSWDPETVKNLNAYYYACSQCIELLKKAKKGEF